MSFAYFVLDGELVSIVQACELSEIQRLCSLRMCGYFYYHVL